MLRGELAHTRTACLPDIWTPVTSEVLLLKREPDNIHDKYAVVVVRQSNRTTVGRISYNLAPIASPFLARDLNK